MQAIVRELGERDLPDLLALYEHLHAQDTPLPAEEMVAEIWRTLMADPRQIYIGACFGERLVSACNAVIVPNLTRGARPYALVENVVTDREYRRRGLARRTLQALMDECWVRGCYKIMLMSNTRRTEAHAFYEALGFDAGAKKAFVARK